MKIIAYTDGSAVSSGVNKGKGGYGVYFPNLFGVRRSFSRGFKDTKTGRMEVMALYKALSVIEKYAGNNEVLLQFYSDSQYVTKCFTESRLVRWKINNWKNTSGDVKNVDIFKEIYRIAFTKPNIKVRAFHIKSHQLDKEKDPKKLKELKKNPHIVGNYLADKLADYKNHVFLRVNDNI